MKAVLTGGPAESVALQLAQTAESTVLNAVRGQVVFAVQQKAENLTFKIATERHLAAHVSLAGVAFDLGPREFAIGAGQLAGGVADALLDASARVIAGRGTAFSNFIHDNSHRSPKPNHVYVIVDTRSGAQRGNAIVKPGISGQKLNLNGTISAGKQASEQMEPG